MLSSSSVSFNNWPALQLENDFARLIVIPAIGGKIVSIQSCVTGREFLWQDPSRPYRRPQYGDPFGNYDASGFDECFPTIAECVYPEFPWEGITVPDHGELWTLPWRDKLTSDSIFLHTSGIRFPYQFQKRITLAPDAAHFTISYRVINQCPFSLKYLWSAHPLFAAHEGMRIILPSNPLMRFTFAVGGRVGGAYLQQYTWPWVATPSGEPLDYSLIGPAHLGANDKVYAQSPAEGWCALHHEASGDFIGIGFSAQDNPYIGICINHSGWPFEGKAAYWVALEPCTGYPDPLDEAVRERQFAVLPGYGSVEWTLTLDLGQAASSAAIGPMMRHQWRS